MKKKLVIGLIILICLAAAGFTYYKFKNKSSVSAVNYRSVQVEKGDLKISITSAGTVMPDREIEVKSKASGKILKIYVRDGDMVKKGQLLLSLDKTDEQTKLHQAEADVLSAEARLMQSQQKLIENKRTEAQFRSLLDSKLASKEDFLKAQTQRVLSEADVKIAEASLLNAEESEKNSKVSYADTEIRSPIDGLVLERLVEEGQIISSGMSAASGGTQLFSIGDMSKLISKSEVDEVDMGKLALNQIAEIEVDAYEGKIFTGVLTHISPKGIQKSNVTVFDIELEIIDAEKGLLKAGMTNTAKIIVEEKKDVLMVPVYAVQGQGKKKYVFVKENEKYVQKNIKTGISNFDQIEVTDGLSEGETIYFTTNGVKKNNNSGGFHGPFGSNSKSNNAGGALAMARFAH